MHELSAELFLNFDSLEVILLLTLIRAMQIGNSFFFKTLLLLTFSIVINVTLKGIFKYPLPDWLHSHGYAFPSGHMQMGTVFYSWLALSYRKWWVSMSVIVILLGIGYGLMFYGYHDLIDVTGGFICGLSLALAYRYSWSKVAIPLPWIMVSIATACMLYNNFNYELIPVHASIALYVLSFSVFFRSIYFKRI